MSKVINAAKGIIGRIIGTEPKNEICHYYICAICGQTVDKRDLGQVFHHEEVGHEPINEKGGDEVIEESIEGHNG